MEKHCGKCGQTKPVEAFGLSNGKPRSWCKPCACEYQKERYASDPERARARARAWRERYSESYSAIRKARRPEYYAAEISRKYNITKEEAERMLREHGSNCKACNVAFDPSIPLLRRNLDHCHKSGKVRGFLCSRCNTVAGFVNDDPKILIRIATYLKRCIST